MKRSLFLVLLPLCFWTCDKVSSEIPDNNATQTLLVWLSGDNNLGQEVEQKIEALRKGWSETDKRHTCLIYADTEKTGARLLRLLPGKTATVESLADFGPEDSASPEIFGRVLRHVLKTYTADSYGLIFFSHASGWLPAGTLQNPTRSLGWDDNPPAGETTGLQHSEMELSDFAAAIPDGSLDYIIFEACLMAGVEVAYELRRKADFILASSAEMLSPGFTPIYPFALSRLFDSSQSVEQRLRIFGQAYMDHTQSLSGDWDSATLSLIETREMESLADWAKNTLPASFHEPVATNDNAQHFDRPGSYGDISKLPRYFDLAEQIESAGLTAEAYTVFEEQLKRIVKWEAHSARFMPSQNGFEIRRHCGLTVYRKQIPLPALNAAYERTAWRQATRKPDTL